MVRRFDRRHSFIVAAILLGLAASVNPLRAASSLFHAALLRSTPAAKSHLAKSPSTIRLVFSEQVVPELSRIALVGSSGDSAQLTVANDPHDVHVLVGTVVGELSGRYTVVWHVISADGHPVGGEFLFTVATQSPTASSTVPAATSHTNSAAPAIVGSSAGMPASSAEQKPVPVFAALFRGVGLGAFMTGIGILFFGLTAGERRILTPGALVTSLIAVGALLLVAHALMWMENMSPTSHMTGNFVSAVLGSTIGRVELVRVILAVATLWAMALARHRRIALWLGVACIVVSGAIGHPAAIHPYLAIPSKIVHLVAASIWIGGLVWLVWVERYDASASGLEALRVSSLALIAVIAIFLSGLLQTVLFLNTPGDLFHQNYGRLVLAKMIGLAILIGFGAYNRYGLLPKSEAADTTRKLARSVKSEIAIVSIVILIGGFLAYVPTPPLPQPVPSAPTGASQ